MNIDKMIEQWEEKHSSLLNDYSKGNANNEVMQMYRSQMKNVLDFIEQLNQVKNNFALADVSGRSELLLSFAKFIDADCDLLGIGYIEEIIKKFEAINSH